jgi:hypothetical protein
VLTATRLRRIGFILAHGMSVRVACNEDCSATATLAREGSKTVSARGSLPLSAGATRTMSLNLTRPGRRQLRSLRRGQFRLTVTIKDRSGNTRALHRTITFRR